MSKVVLHWLEASRSHRVLWLLEELKVPYELKVCARDAALGNVALKKYHPLARSPVIEVFNENKNLPEIVTETSTIFKYLLKNFDKDLKLTPTDPADRVKMDYYFDFCEATLQPSLIAMMVGKIMQSACPPDQISTYKDVAEHTNDFYHIPGTKTNFNFLNEELAKSKSGWFLGDRLSAADIMFEFALFQTTFDPNIDAYNVIGANLHLKDTYPNIARWAGNVSKDASYNKITKLAAEELAKVKAEL